MSNKHNYSITGLISFVLGIFNVLLSVAIYLALSSYLNHKFGETLFLQVQILNIGSKVELITKPLGLILGIIGLFHKEKNKLFTVLGTLINAVVSLWTLAVFSGLFI
ncbi:hypothetical protein JYG23_04370 [Sedimentibacter sp. zth1]|uniref:hypothetical protein n=1 Tax=Sedimentibacter sp. zth1 TaxID=2816908 RepID=UPI001A91EF00|nr:hypothetical protein [Sedimentibacter sp. zth1]QSX06695.1 hypothetical protein JYG23_04370 [Sedimentibacter sp. zth1]